MAVQSPLMPSPSSLTSAFSPFAPPSSSPAGFSSLGVMQKRTSTHSDTLPPPQSPYPQFIDPSPVDSNGTASTDATEIEDEAEDAPEKQSGALPSPSPIAAAASEAVSKGQESNLGKINVDAANRLRSDSDGGPRSVIHAPPSFTQQFENKSTSTPQSSCATSPTESSENTVVVPSPPGQAEVAPNSERAGLTVASLNTSVTSNNINDRPTPRAQSVQELDDGSWKDRKQQMNLEGIPENTDLIHGEDFKEETAPPREATPTDPNAAAKEETRETIASLKTALSECWTLCNTLAGLSSTHRKRIFSFQGTSHVQESAWRSCWKLCQNLYDSRNEDHATHVLPTLEMCRDFCQALFEARQRNDDTASVDSVLRVSFELNNHLYNAHDRNLPFAFQERTLEFYLTLCHRLMKQRTSLPEETDALLRACWSLAEMLFSLRQNNRDGKPADEELLGSAVQACWDLCDLFRDGWTQIRPERGTPRATQNAFISQPAHRRTPPYNDRDRDRSSSHGTSRNYHDTRYVHPETPTTIFDDTIDSMDDDSDVPNILILGPEHNTSSHNRWSSAASTNSGYSESSHRSESLRSSVSQTTVGSDDINITRIQALLLKAAFNAGYQRPSSATTSSSSGPVSLLAFVKAMPSNSFGSAAWQMNLLEKYKKLVLADPLFRSPQLPGKLAGRRTTAAEIARAVQWLMRSEQYLWLRDLFRMVLGSHPEDAKSLHGVMVQT